MADTPEAGKPELTPANENPWYCLMTLHGEQPEGAHWVNIDEDLHAKNRRDWNKWASRALSEDHRRTLLAEKDCDGKPRFLEEELTPHNRMECLELAIKFEKRCFRTANMELPEPQDSMMLSYIEFSRFLYVRGFLFPAHMSQKITDFIGSKFLTFVDFRNVTFLGRVNFSGTAFFSISDFYGATFSGAARFRGAHFHYFIELAEATFSDTVDLSEAIFLGDAYLSESTFSSNVDLSGATFSGTSFLINTTFSGDANLSGTIFSADSRFSGAIFLHDANFSGAKFSRQHAATFEHVTFSGETRFLNAELEGDTSFARAKFLRHPPQFHGAKLNEGTAFDGVEWPNPPEVPIQPARTGDAEKDRWAKWDWEYAHSALESDIKSYQRLKQMMETLKKHEDELDFFAQEMACKRVLLKANGETAKAWLFGLYAWTSDYGRSILRPLVAMFSVFLPTAVIFEQTQRIGDGCAALAPVQAWGTSLATLLSVLPGLKDMINYKCLSALAMVTAGFNAVAGGVLLFLIGLALRNRFRMK